MESRARHPEMLMASLKVIRTNRLNHDYEDVCFCSQREELPL